MGIENFNSWLKTRHPTCYEPVNKKIKYEYIHIDMNNLYHTAIRNVYGNNNKKTEQEFINKIYNSLNMIFNNFFATKKVVLAVDGASPYSKIILQRKRRLQAVNNINVNKLSSLHLTPGTRIMDAVDKALKSYVTDLKNSYSVLKTEFEVLSTDCPGEGEIKIFEKMLEYSKDNPDDTHLVIGNDADLVVLAMAVKPIYNINLLIRSKDSLELLSIKKLLKDHVDITTTLQKKLSVEEYKEFISINNLTNSDIRADFVILSIMNGNDYLPKLNYVKFDTLWNAYRDTIMNTNDTLIKNGIFNKKILIHFMGNVINRLPNQYKKPNLNNVYNRLQTISYMEGLLWCLNMYQNGKCQMNDYVYTGIGSPSPYDILYFVMFNDDYKFTIPKSDVLPLQKGYYCLLLMPYKAKCIIPEKYHSLMETKLKYLYEKELCEQCEELKTKYNKWSCILKECKNNVESLENPNEEDKEELKEIRKKITNVTKEIISHNKKDHEEFSVKDITNIVECAKKIK